MVAESPLDSSWAVLKECTGYWSMREMESVKQRGACEHVACISPWLHRAAELELPMNLQSTGMLTLTKPLRKSRIYLKLPLLPRWHRYVKHAGMQLRHNSHTTGLFCTSTVLKEPSAREEDAAKNWFVARLHCTHRRYEDLRVTSTARWCASSASSGPPSKVVFLKGNSEHPVSPHWLHLFTLTMFQSSSGPQQWRSLAFLARVQKGWAYQMSFLSLIDNDNKSKAITYKILSSLRCCWMSAGTAAFPHKHFRYYFLLFGLSFQ